MNAQTKELTLVARAAEVTAKTLMVFKKSVDDLLIEDDDMNILLPDDQAITDKQKSLLTLLIRRNFVDKGEIEKKLSDLDSYSKADANLVIKELLPHP